MIETFRRRGNKLPVDIEHATQIKGALGEAAPAVGFIEELEARDGGLWARVAWNAAGEALLKGRTYAHLSPVFVHDDRQEIKRLVSVGLTNNPNLDLVALNKALSPEQETPSMDKAVLEALGLNADASAADAVVAITRLKETRDTALNQAKTPDPEKFVPKADYDLAMNQVQGFKRAETERHEKAIEDAVDAAIEAGKVAPASRDYHVAACRASENGLASFQAWTATAPEQVGPARTRQKEAANSAGTAGLSPEELAICKATGMSPEAFAEGKKEQEA